MVKRMLFFLLVPVAMLGGCSAHNTENFTPSRHQHPVLNFYQGPLDHLHAVRSGKCGMSPSCSSYAAQSFQNRSFFDAWFASFDRLLRCGRDLGHPNIRWVPAPGGPKVFDPVVILREDAPCLQK
ncbi:membrane protein insertion efficiency factor YidD [Desulfobotulus sp. H1]|uniref:Membrane protein insertion efficiency factor YidD n=1 Tax=Desulfobotulus pelophilus TaxID=2823377 RepID=A0ABT3NCM0_9BACT|nr:membrane protein insertion efficiency factor YidD [Desulfobotulus pelophilus]MCW7755215.1 membrane protein insertion efficiency factor YidD [Desulfobotulus pelophilus]